jgi:hypothetical protein
MTIATTTTRNKLEFPDHLAYAVAIPETRRWEKGAVVQDDYLHGERVLTASIAKDSATVQEWWKGQALHATTDPDLQQALLAHFLLMDQSTSPIHAFWMRKLCELGNIYVDSLPQPTLEQLRYPAVYPLTLRIPVREENQKAAFAFMQHPLVRKYGYRYCSTTLFINKLNGKQFNQDIHLLEIGAPLAFLYDVAKAAVAEEVILKSKLYRAFVQTAFHQEGSQLKYWPGINGDDWRGYGVVIRDRESRIEDQQPDGVH